ncbi:hypothetical protein I3842_16G070800 [Carya illinoinensis]|uniref:Uncharacterized protein n=1 Tax=Carya illinoinensis TaxID=32201 RepID=A0A922A0R9_CARIL|nr:hypothetical protein I3842_16G070800 [Carya illinoinensis]
MSLECFQVLKGVPGPFIHLHLRDLEFGWKRHSCHLSTLRCLPLWCFGILLAGSCLVSPHLAVLCWFFSGFHFRGKGSDFFHHLPHAFFHFNKTSFHGR